MSELLLWCLRLLLPDQRLPDHGYEWLGLLDCWSEGQRLEMASQESTHFVKAGESVFGGEMVHYSREVMSRQRGQLSVEDARSLVRDLMLIR
jgi:hypothetical protein